MARGLTAVSIAHSPRLSLMMTDPVFQQAYETVRQARSDEEWDAMTPRQITNAIYQEIRRIDADAAKQAGTATPQDGC